jgi:UDP-N-acetylglucosamine acyltransferase
MSRVADGAKLADDVEVGPFCTVGADVELRAGVKLLSNVNVTGVTVVGERTVVYPFASLGTPPQSTGYRGEPTKLEIGSDCVIREGVTANTGTAKDRGVTTIGDRCFLMVNSHVGHDCVVGNDVIFANGVLLGGHVQIGDKVFLGGNAAVHQFVRVGEGAMIGGVSGITRDVIPFGFAFGPRADLVGLNVIGLKRRGHSRDEIHRARRAYRDLFEGYGSFEDRVKQVAEKFSSDALVGKIVAFIQASGSRSIMKTATSGGSASDDVL